MTHAGYHRLRSLAITLLLAAAGCTVLAPQKDESKFYLLTPIPVGASTAMSPVNPGRELSIGIGPVTFPGYLKRSEIVTRTSDDQLVLSENQRWAESLDANFQSVLAQDLSQMLATQRIVIFPWYGTTHIDYQVEIQVSRFDASSDRQSRLTARWSIKNGANGNILFATETTNTSAVAGDDLAGSAALSRDVAELSREIANRIRELNSGGTIASVPDAN
jgi:uncharacterized protein